jgi:hypothetical protein
VCHRGLHCSGCVIVVILMLLTLPRAEAEEVDLIDTLGQTTLADLGVGDVVLTEFTEQSVAVGEYYLQDDSTQGPEVWYRLWMHARLSLSEASGNGTAYVSAFTNDRSVAQIRLQTMHFADNWLIMWDTLDLHTGSKLHFTMSPDIELEFRNYLQDSGVIPGLNTLSVGFSATDEVQLNSITLHDDSAIERTKESPPQLVLKVDLPRDDVEVGDIVSLSVNVRNTGVLAARNVTVAVAHPGNSMIVHGGETKYFPTLLNKEDITFDLEWTEPGKHEFDIYVQSGSGGNPFARIEANVMDD